MLLLLLMNSFIIPLYFLHFPTILLGSILPVSLSIYILILSFKALFIYLESYKCIEIDGHTHTVRESKFHMAAMASLGLG